MSVIASLQSWPMRNLEDHRPLVASWNQSFGSSSLDYDHAVKLCEFYGFRASVCDSFVTLRQCLEMVYDLFSQRLSFHKVSLEYQVAISRFLGLSEPKSFLSEAAVKKFSLVFSSFDAVMTMDFLDVAASSTFGKDVLRIFQAILGIAVQDAKGSKSAHLCYLAHAQRVIRKEVGAVALGWRSLGDRVPTSSSNQINGVNFPPGLVGSWVLILPEENSIFYAAASDWLLLFLALLSGCGNSGPSWPEEEVLEYVRYVDCDSMEGVKTEYLTPILLSRMDLSDLEELLKLMGYPAPILDASQAISVLVSSGTSGQVSLVRGDPVISDSPFAGIRTRSVLATAVKRGLPTQLSGAVPLCRSCPDIDPATDNGWVERQSTRRDYRLWDVQSLRNWLISRVNPPHVSTSKHMILAQIGAWLSERSVDGLRRSAPGEPATPFPPIVYHDTRQFSDNVCSRVFSVSTLQRLSLYVLQAEMATLCPTFLCASNDKAIFSQTVVDAYPIRAFGEAKLNSWLFLQRSQIPIFTKCTWPPVITQDVLVALPFFDSANEGAEPVIAYYGLMKRYQQEDTVLLSVVNASSTVPTMIEMSKGDVVATCYAAPTVVASVGIRGGHGLDFPRPFPPVSPGSQTSLTTSPSTSVVFPFAGFRCSAPDGGERSAVTAGDPLGVPPVPKPPSAVTSAGLSGVTLVAREQPSRAKGDRALKALMIADAYIQMVSVDPSRLLNTVMADVFLSLVTHTGILTQLALVEVTQILQSVNFPSYALAVPLTMSPRHDVSQAFTTAKLFVGWRSEEPFPEARAVRYDYRSNDPSLVYRVLWTIFRIRYGYFEFYTEIWDALVRYALRCEKLVRDLLHWTQEAVDFMVKKSLRDLEMVDDRVGLTVPSALIAPSPDAVQASPILSSGAYIDAIDLLPDMRASDAYYMHHNLVMQAQKLYFDGVSVRHVVPLEVVPVFKQHSIGGNRVARVESSAIGADAKGKSSVMVSPSPVKHSSSPSATANVSKKDRVASNKKKRQFQALLTAVPATQSVPTPGHLPPLKRVPLKKNKPCHQWLSTVGCSTGAGCRFDHDAPSNKDVWEYCNRRLGELGLTAGVHMGVCPAF